MNKVHVISHANIALIKYWGKRDHQLILPSKSSLSVGVAALATRTTLSIIDGKKDLIILEGNENGKLLEPVRHFLDTTRALFGINKFFSIYSKNLFPTASGLASSASGFSALAIGLNSLCKLGLNKQQLSILARHGSGSAARSIFGGFVLWHKGLKPDGSDSYAEQIATNNDWPTFRILIVVTTRAAKKISSRTGMQASLETSPNYTHWLAQSENRIGPMIDAISRQDFSTVGTLAQADWEDMRDVMLSTTPTLDYWSATSHTIIATITKLKMAGVACYITTDAGPHVKILCLAQDALTIKNNLYHIAGIVEVIESDLAQEPILIEE